MQSNKKIIDMPTEDIIAFVKNAYAAGEIIECVLKKYPARNQYFVVDVETDKFVVSKGLSQIKFTKILFDDVREVTGVPLDERISPPFKNRLDRLKIVKEEYARRNS